jgi:hypothetical protein
MFVAEWNYRAFTDGDKRLKLRGNKICKRVIDWNIEGNIDKE